MTTPDTSEASGVRDRVAAFKKRFGMSPEWDMMERHPADVSQYRARIRLPGGEGITGEWKGDKREAQCSAIQSALKESSEQHNVGEGVRMEGTGEGAHLAVESAADGRRCTPCRRERDFGLHSSDQNWSIETSARRPRAHLAVESATSRNNTVLPEGDRGWDAMLELSMSYIIPTELFVVRNVARRFWKALPQGVLFQALVSQTQRLHEVHREGEDIYGAI